MQRVDHVGVYTRESSGERRLRHLGFYFLIHFCFLKGNKLRNRPKRAFRRVYQLYMLCRLYPRKLGRAAREGQLRNSFHLWETLEEVGKSTYCYSYAIVQICTHMYVYTYTYIYIYL